MSGRPTTVTITAAPDEVAALAHLLRQTSIRSALARRARVVVMRMSGATITDIAAMVGMDRKYVYKWLQRWQAQGIAGLNDKPGRGGVRRRRVREEP